MNAFQDCVIHRMCAWIASKAHRKKPVCSKDRVQKSKPGAILISVQKNVFLSNFFFTKPIRGSVTASMALFTPGINVCYDCKWKALSTDIYVSHLILQDTSGNDLQMYSMPNIYSVHSKDFSFLDINEGPSHLLFHPKWLERIFFTTRLIDKDNSHVMTQSKARCLISLVVPSLVHLLRFISSPHIIISGRYMR